MVNLESICKKMVVREVNPKTKALNSPSAAAIKLPIPILANAKGNVRNRKASIQCLIIFLILKVQMSSGFIFTKKIFVSNLKSQCKK